MRKVFNSRIDDLTKKFILKEQGPLSYSDQIIWPYLYKNILAELFEELILYDKITIKLSKNNAPLAVLINELGIELVQELIKEGTIELVLWLPWIVVGQGQDGKGQFDSSYLKGQPSIVVAWQANKEYSEPFHAIENAISLLKGSYAYRKKSFIADTVDKVILFDQEAAHASSDFILESYRNNILGPLGVPYTLDHTELGYEQRLKLLTLANKLLDVTFLSKNKCDTHNDYEANIITSTCLTNVRNTAKIAENTNTILKIENLPSLKQFFFEEHISLKDIVKLRNKNATNEFRKWIHSVEENMDSKDLTEEYLNAISGKKQKIKNKFLKTGLIYTVGAGMGSIIGAATGNLEAGALVGISIPTAIQTLTSLGYSYFNSYVIEKFLGGWNPRLFIDELKLKQNNKL
ncbi:hypothetical protein [Draconibacterium orientale]|uniref:hypothetical protein n=1 Tax=Draconibacterium orientale TaxID=1168034 RepID=UPI0029C0DBBD|nr:hypothetical protein [Draconibacterium orientale]